MFIFRSLNQNLPPYEVLYHQLVSLKSDDFDEFTLVIKLAQALRCHGYDQQASKLAFVLGQKIILTYPERISAGELNFTEITEKAKAICETFTKCLENERLTFELAILGLTVPRFPAQTNLEEVSIYISWELKLVGSQRCFNVHLTLFGCYGRKMDVVLTFFCKLGYFCFG